MTLLSASKPHFMADWQPLIWLKWFSCFPLPRPYGRSLHSSKHQRVELPSSPLLPCGGSSPCRWPKLRKLWLHLWSAGHYCILLPGEALRLLSNSARDCAQARFTLIHTHTHTHTEILIPLLMWAATWHSYAEPISWQTHIHTAPYCHPHSLPSCPLVTHTKIFDSFCFILSFRVSPLIYPSFLILHVIFWLKSKLWHINMQKHIGRLWLNFFYSIVHLFFFFLGLSHKQHADPLKTGWNSNIHTPLTDFPTAAQSLTGNRWKKISDLLCAWALRTGLFFKEFFKHYQNSQSHVSSQWLTFKPI